MRKIVTCIAILFQISVFACSAQEASFKGIPGLTEDTYYRIAGVWNYITYPLKGKMILLSWGWVEAFEVDSIIIDLDGPKPFFYLGSDYHVIEFDARGNDIQVMLQDKFDNEDKGSIILHFLDDGSSMWVENLLPGDRFMNGVDYIYHKTSSPVREE